jgi:hypothetical protein
VLALTCFLRLLGCDVANNFRFTVMHSLSGCLDIVRGHIYTEQATEHAYTAMQRATENKYKYGNMILVCATNSLGFPTRKLYVCFAE